MQMVIVGCSRGRLGDVERGPVVDMQASDLFCLFDAPPSSVAETTGNEHLPV